MLSGKLPRVDAAEVQEVSECHWSPNDASAAFAVRGWEELLPGMYLWHVLGAAWEGPWSLTRPSQLCDACCYNTCAFTAHQPTNTTMIRALPHGTTEARAHNNHAGAVRSARPPQR